MKSRLRRIFEDYAFFQRCEGYEQGTVNFLLAERKRQGAQDRGEVEVIVQASQFGTTVLVDDHWGRELAQHYELDFHGTIWVLERFRELGLLSSGELRSCFESLRRRRTRLPWQTVNELLAGLGERPL
jgi:predicted nucleic acid-binding protein